MKKLLYFTLCILVNTPILGCGKDADHRFTAVESALKGVWVCSDNKSNELVITQDGKIIWLIDKEPVAATMSFDLSDKDTIVVSGLIDEEGGKVSAVSKIVFSQEMKRLEFDPPFDTRIGKCFQKVTKK